MRVSVAVTFVEAFTLERDDLARLLVAFGGFERQLRARTMRLATRRAFVIEARRRTELEAISPSELTFSEVQEQHHRAEPLPTQQAAVAAAAQQPAAERGDVRRNGNWLRRMASGRCRTSVGSGGSSEAHGRSGSSGRDVSLSRGDDGGAPAASEDGNEDFGGQLLGGVTSGSRTPGKGWFSVQELGQPTLSIPPMSSASKQQARAAPAPVAETVAETVAEAAADVPRREEEGGGRPAGEADVDALAAAVRELSAQMATGLAAMERRQEELREELLRRLPPRPAPEAGAARELALAVTASAGEEAAL